MKKIITIITLLVLGFTSVSYASVDKNLKYGQRDNEVMELQEFLIDKGFLKTAPSNYFGLLTLKAVKAYQTSIGVSSTGFVGILTREKINKEINAELLSSNEAEKAEEVTSSSNAQQVNTKPLLTNTKTVTTNVNSVLSNDGIFDTNLKIDKLGRKIIITETPNYKTSTVVRAKTETSNGSFATGFYYKLTESFKTESELSEEIKKSQEEQDRKSGIIKPTTSSIVAEKETPTVYITPIKTYYLDAAKFSYELNNVSDKTLEVKSINYHINIDGGFFDANIPVVFSRVGTAISGVSQYPTNITGYQNYTFERPLIILPKEAINISIQYPVNTNNGFMANKMGVSETSFSIGSIDFNPGVSTSQLPIKTKAVLGTR